MSFTVSRELHERLGLMRRALQHCRAGGFSFARFLALAPDQLRLASGATVTETEVPLAIAPTLVRTFEGLLDVASATTTRPADPDALRRTLGFAQRDPELDPLGLGAWLEGSGPALLEALRRIELVGLRELGRGAGGEQVAYLVHLALLAVLRDVIAARSNVASRGSGGSIPEAVLAASFVELALAACALGAPGGPTEPSLRLGLQLALTSSPVALGASADALSTRPLNAYRTTHAALALARRIVVEPLEAVDLDRVVAAIAERLSVDDETASLLGRDMLLELVRDAASAALMKPSGASDADRAPLRALVSSIPALVGGVVKAARRRELAEAARAGRFGRSKAVDALERSLSSADAVLGGDHSVLGARGDLGARARLAALGAVVLVLDEHADRARSELTRMFAPVAPDRAEDAWREGRAYWIGLDDRPLARRSRATAEAELAISVETSLARILSHGTGPRPELVDRELFTPLLTRIAAHSGPGSDELAIGGITATGLHVHGDVVAVVGLLRAIEALRTERALARAAEVADVLGGARRAESSRPLFAPACFAAFGPVVGSVPVEVPSLGLASRLSIPSRLAELSAGTAPLARVGAGATDRAERDVAPAFHTALAPRGETIGLHNEGSAISGALLAAFEAARQGLVIAEEHGLAVSSLAEDVRRTFVFPRDAETFRVLRGGESVVLLVRWVGSVHVDPSVAEPTDVWELVDDGSVLGRAILAALPRGGRA